MAARTAVEHGLPRHRHLRHGCVARCGGGRPAGLGSLPKRSGLSRCPWYSAARQVRLARRRDACPLAWAWTHSDLRMSHCSQRHWDVYVDTWILKPRHLHGVRGTHQTCGSVRMRRPFNLEHAGDTRHGGAHLGLGFIIVRRTCHGAGHFRPVVLHDRDLWLAGGADRGRICAFADCLTLTCTYFHADLGAKPTVYDLMS